MTEDEARKKWCPMVRHTSEHNEPASNKCGTPSGECVGEGKWNKCIASNCAMWVVDTVDIEEKPKQGHCGLINK